MIEVSNQPAWPTTLRARLQDGRLQGIDNSVWMYRAVPLAPVSDARSPEESLLAAEPVLAMFEELAGQVTGSMKRRSMAKGSYRDVHLLLVNVPQRFEPDRNSPLAEYLRQQFPGTAIDRRVLLFGVRLRDKIGSGGWRQAVDSVIDTIMVGGTALADFDEDTAKVNAAMDRSGLVALSGDEVRLANAWWNHGHYADTPTLVHPDHVHIFDSTESVNMAHKAGLDACPTWTRESVPGTHAVTFTSVMDLDLDFVDPKNAHAHWASDLIDAGAFAISIRGRVEPGVITREELRRQRKRFIDDINERHKQGKMDRAEQTEMLGLLEGVEGLYGTGGNPPPTLASCSIVVGFDGQYRDATSILPQGAPAKLAMMEYRQNGAMAETWLCSPKRANPHLHDLPVQVIAASGLPSLSFVGDRDGALAGFSERDRQPSYLSPTSASSGDAAPLMLVPGQTGSGKRLTLSTPIPTPSGWTTMGALSVGDAVLSGDGAPCRVTGISDIEERPDLYRVIFDDGTEVLADAEHQWMVTDHRVRNGRNGDAWGKKSIANREAMQADLDRLLAVGSTFSDSHESTIQDLAAIVMSSMEKPRWTSWFSVLSALDFMDTPYVSKSRRDLGMTPGGRPLRIYNTRVALKSLAMRLDQSLTSRPLAERGEFRMTTAEMIGAGLHVPSGANFAVRLAGSDLPEVDLPLDPYVLGAWLGDGSRADGRIASASVASCTDEDGLTDQEHMLATLTAAGFGASPLPSNPDYVVSVRGLAPRLREMGLIGDKHIPAAYLRASFDQRLALVQGLMDTDGSISKKGIATFSQKEGALFDQFVELARSLGIKVNVFRKVRLSKRYLSDDGTSYRKDSGTGCVATFRTTLPVVTIPRKAARLPKKVSKRASHKYIKDIVPVLPGQDGYEAARCISVDSPDHTYLCDQFTVTLNTQFMQWVATQFARSGRPTIILDPKMGSDLSPVVHAVGGQVASLDRLLTADGIFDPLRFSATPEVGVELATSMLMSINVWGTRREDMEVPLQYALAYGVSKGANCTGQALAIAERDLGDTLPDTLVSAVRNMSESSAMFRACVGWDPNGTGLRVAEGLTLIKVGDAHLDLPDPGIPLHTLGINQRITTVLVRMMVFGSAMSLAGRDGVLCADEAWVILGAGKAEVERLGRLARSQRVLPILFTQRVTDALKAGLTGYISRGFILPMEDPEEAEAACRLFRLDPTDERMGRLMAKATKGGNSANAVAPNWYSMRALRDPVTGDVIRGSIGIYVDLSGRAVPVEVTLPAAFLKDSTTNAEDLRRREADRAAAAEALAQQQSVEVPEIGDILTGPAA